MASINSRETVDKIIAANGKLPGETQVTHIWQYQNMFDGGTTFGIVWKGEDWRRYENCAGSGQKLIWTWPDFAEKKPRRK